MKILQSGVVRALCAIVVGGLLIKYREQTVTWMTIAIGVLFFVSGALSCASYFSARRHKDDPQVFDANGRQLTGFTPTFPIVGLGSILLGLALAIMPDVFVTWLMYILSAILILGAVSQYVTLHSASRVARIGWGFWLMPTVLLLVGVLAVVYPSAIASAPLLVIGWSMVVYGVVEIVNVVKVHQLRRQFERLAQTQTTADTTTTAASEEI